MPGGGGKGISRDSIALSTHTIKHILDSAKRFQCCYCCTCIKYRNPTTLTCGKLCVVNIV